MILQKRVQRKKIGFIFGGISLIILGVLFFVASKNHYSSYSSNSYSNLIIAFISAVAGSVLVCLVSILIEKTSTIKKLFLFLGVKTIGMVYFQFIAFKLVNLIVVKVYDLDASRVRDFPVNYDYNSAYWSLTYVVFGVLISIVLYEGFTRIQKWIKNILTKRME